MHNNNNNNDNSNPINNYIIYPLVFQMNLLIFQNPYEFFTFLKKKKNQVYNREIVRLITRKNVEQRNVHFSKLRNIFFNRFFSNFPLLLLLCKIWFFTFLIWLSFLTFLLYCEVIKF